MRETAFAFDLDGTITREELLPLIAGSLGLEREMKVLTELTLSGAIDFEDSFRLRCAVLRSVPVSQVHDIVAQVQLSEHVVDFIRDRLDDCYVVSGNLDAWISPLADRLKCRFFSSTAHVEGDHLLGVEHVLRKSEAVAELAERYERVVAIGDSVNDVPMFEVAHVRVAFGGVHPPAQALYEQAHYVTYEEKALCRILTML